MADEVKKPFRQYFYRGVEAEKLLDVPQKELLQMLHARARRRLVRGNNKGFEHLLVRLRKSKKAMTDPTQKPTIVKTHLRNALIVPEMIGSQVGVYNGLGYHLVEVKPNMVGHYLGEFSLTYIPVQHGKSGQAATAVNKFLPVK